MIPIVLNGRAVDLEHPVFVRLINCVDDADFAAFGDRFDEGDTLEPARERYGRLADRLREAVEFTLGGPISPTPGGMTVRSWDANRFLNEAKVRPQLVVRSGSFVVVLSVPDLPSFMAMEFAAAVEAGVRSRRCDQCHKVFLFGPQTGRRSHGKYCADRCRVAAARARAKEGEA